MTRSILLSVFAGMLLALPSGAASVGSGRIAYETESGGLYTVNATGSGLENLRTGGSIRFSWPRWSPDGSRIAFTEYSGTPGQFHLHVTNQDGSNDRVVATGYIFLSRRPWSPDGSRIAWGPYAAPGDLYTASATGGDVRRLTTDGRPKYPPLWSPIGSTLVYPRGFDAPGWDLFLVDADGSGPTQVTRGGENLNPSWSPDGSKIAFSRQTSSESAIYVVRPDGTELHRVAGTLASSGEVDWSPDSTKIAYTNAVNSGYSRYGGRGQEIFVVNADGSEDRRLTELAPRLAYDAAPTWSPDGDQILFRRGYGTGVLMTMNPDGKCEGVLESTTSAIGAPSWQPLPSGPRVGPKTCRAVSVEATGTALGDLSSFLIAATLRNEGTETLTNLFVTFKASRHDLGITPYGSDCSSIPTGILCRIDRLERRETRVIAALGTARRVGADQRGRDVQLRADVKVTADGPLSTTERETNEARFTPGRCTSRDRGRGRIDGTRFPDRICGRRGADDIHPWAGKDIVNAGGGRDRIFSRDDKADVITCGPGRDRVVADREDKVARDCESVLRRRY
jgi:TolB protein